MLKLMDKKIIAILRLNNLLNWHYARLSQKLTSSTVTHKEFDVLLREMQTALIYLLLSTGLT